MRQLGLLMLLLSFAPPARGEEMHAPEGSADQQARVTKASADALEIARALARLRADTGSSAKACLTDLKHLSSSVGPSACGRNLPNCRTADPGSVCWGGPYLSGFTNDPWGHPYVVRLGAQSLVTVISMGPDGKLGTADDLSAQQ